MIPEEIKIKMDADFCVVLQEKDKEKMIQKFKDFCFKYDSHLKLMAMINSAYYALPISIVEHVYYNNRWNTTDYKVAVCYNMIQNIFKANMPLKLGVTYD